MNDRNALETHLPLCDDIEINLSFADYINQDFTEWLESVTYKVDYSLPDMEYFNHLQHNLDMVVE